MKNKMKKSKIIVPALALITATTVASVTGTVAWFTASRVATVNSSVFESQTLNSNMTVSTTALVGTKDATASTATLSDKASITVNGKLTHGSYNAKEMKTDSEGNLYVARVNGDKTSAEVTAYDDYGTLSNAKTHGIAPTTTDYSKWSASVDSTTQANSVWYAVAWSMDFTVTNSSTLAENSALFFDPSTTTFADSATGDGTKTIQGLRIALMTSENYVVVGGLETNGTETEKHVTSSWDGKSGKTSDHVGSFNKEGETAHYFKYGDSLATANDADDTTLKEHAGYLGTLTSNKITVTAVAWFEGEDSSVITTSTMSKVTASLKFYSRNIKKA